MYFENALWYSKTNGRKKLLLLLLSLILILPALVLIFVGSRNANETLTLCAVVAAGVGIVWAIAVVIAGACTSLKWDVNNLVFAVADEGLYFTGVVNQDSYFSARWDEIEAYSYVMSKDGYATVTVYFDGVAEAGSFGKVKYLKMVNISEFGKLKAVFSEKNVPERNA